MSNRLAILLPSAHQATPGTAAQSVWDDLRVALASIAAYAPGHEVVVGWDGPEEPTNLPVNPRMRLARQPPGIKTAGAAWTWCAAQTEAEELLVIGDDRVLHPDTVRLIREDVAAIHEQLPQTPVGFLGARSNCVTGLQNVRSANGAGSGGINYDSEMSIIKVDMVVPVAAWVRHDVFDSVGGFPDISFYSEDVCCWDMVRAGYSHFISRAYVHRVGPRNTEQDQRSQERIDQSREWVLHNRPNFARDGLGIATPVTLGAGAR